LKLQNQTLDTNHLCFSELKFFIP